MLVPDLGTYVDWGLLALRVAVGIIFVVHGWPKITGARGMAEMMGRPGTASVAFFTIQGIVEAGGGVLLILGIWTQLVNVLFAIIMVGAIYLKLTMMKTGFMATQTTGWEFDFVLLAANLALLTLGPGAVAVLPSVVSAR
ncbi:MAG TPA: DoxX family protein [Candidatus Binatia bacterium]|nr:DoxX family protein [Candidatus Binatia bacterium]